MVENVEELIGPPTVHVSNCTNFLIYILRDNLFMKDRGGFFKNVIFLPDKNLKNKIMVKSISDKAINVVIGVKFENFLDGIQNILNSVTNANFRFPSAPLLSLYIESILKPDDKDMAPILASEFLKFGKFGGDFINEWQEHIWNDISKFWNYRYQILNVDIKPPKSYLNIHLFNFPFLPRLYHLFFLKISKFVKVNYYQFSPCKEFWSDVLDGNEISWLVKKNPKILNYLSGGNRLLSNFGKLGRENFKVFEEEDFIVEEHYKNVYSNSAVSSFQKDVLNFNEYKVKQDGSIRFFSAHSKLRELEILYDILMKLDVLPSDIQIFAPNISQYLPLINYVFGSSESPFDFSVLDVPSSDFLESLFLIFNLNRFDTKSILSLFFNKHFSMLSKAEASEFKSWIDRCEIKWGVDRNHRKKILPNYLEYSDLGTWEQAFDNLLDNLIFIPKTRKTWDLPYLNFSDGDLLSKSISTIRLLKKDLDFINENNFTLIDWVDIIYEIIDRYLTVDENSIDEYLFVEKKLQNLKDFPRVNSRLFSFESIKRYLFYFLGKYDRTVLSNQIESLTFKSLKVGSIISSRVIALLGMNEGDFPRTHIKSSMSLLNKNSDFSPSTYDEDRYCFLEAILSARDYLIISYQNINEEDGKEQFPSLLVQELDLKAEQYPIFPFHHQYFKCKNRYNFKYFEMAKEFYAKRENIPFISEFLIETKLPKPSQKKLEIPISHLLRFASHPIRYYFNQKLNVYFPYEDKAHLEFQLSKLNSKELFLETFEEAEKSGHLPLGRFKEIAKRNLNSQSDITCKHIDIRIENFHIFGMVKIPKYGNNISELIRYYPIHLLCNENEGALLRYLRYYQVAIQTPSPLHPLLANSFLKREDFNDFNNKMKDDFLSDTYHKVAFSNADAKVIFDRWERFLKDTFQELL